MYFLRVRVRPSRQRPHHGHSQIRVHPTEHFAHRSPNLERACILRDKRHVRAAAVRIRHLLDRVHRGEAEQGNCVSFTTQRLHDMKAHISPSG